MAFPTIYFESGTSGSGSSDSASAKHTGTAATVSGSVVTLDGSPDLSDVATDGSETIYLDQATNSNQKIFRITAVDNGADTVTVDTAPTGVTSSNWAIGGQRALTAAEWEGAAAAGWTFQLGYDISGSGDVVTCRAAGDPTGDGRIRFVGKPGIRPTITCTGANQCIEPGTLGYWHIENLECAQQGASGDAVNLRKGWVVNNVLVTDAGDDGVHEFSDDNLLVDCEVSGCADGGFVFRNVAFGCYIHDNTGEGFDAFSVIPVMINCISDTNGQDNFHCSVADGGVTIINCTSYNSGGHGVLVEGNAYWAIVANTISADEGGYNINITMTGGERSFVHFNNILFNGTSGNANGFSLDSSEVTTDPQFTDAANGDFSVASNSPARGAGWPGAFPGGLSTGYPDIGAVQGQPVGGLRIAGRGGLAG